MHSNKVMDKEQARFILQSFRPDGADAKDPDFAEALAVAAEDRELGDWLAAERAQDAAFAAALNALEIPDDLRENILMVLRGDHPEEAFSDMDSDFIGALASVQPPEGLRDQIVTAMKVETTSSVSSSAKTAPKRVQSWMRSAAVAAALVLGAFVALEMTNKDRVGPDPQANHRISLETFENASIKLVAGGPELVKKTDLSAINSFLFSQERPGATAAELPPGLAGMKAVGCKLLKLGEKNASLLCFDKDGQTVHLVVVRREDLVETELATLGNVKSEAGSCRQCAVTKLSVATWGDDEHAFLLLSKTDPDKLRKEFF